MMSYWQNPCLSCIVWAVSLFPVLASCFSFQIESSFALDVARVYLAAHLASRLASPLFALCPWWRGNSRRCSFSGLAQPSSWDRWWNCEVRKWYCRAGSVAGLMTLTNRIISVVHVVLPVELSTDSDRDNGGGCEWFLTERRSLNAWCPKHCVAVNRQSGSSLSIASIKAIMSCAIMCAYLRCRQLTLWRKASRGNLSPLKLGFSEKRFIWSGGKGPSTFCITINWSISDSPGNRGWPSDNSPMIHPMDQTSTARPYGAPSSNSGARYHLVATYSN